MDGDGVCDDVDPDIDGDGWGNQCDPNPNDSSKGGGDLDGDGICDLKDGDIDGDTVPNECDVHNDTSPEDAVERQTDFIESQKCKIPAIPEYNLASQPIVPGLPVDPQWGVLP